MRLPRFIRSALGIIRRRVIAGCLGIHFRLKRHAGGVTFACHRDPAFIDLFDSSAFDLERYWKHAFFPSSKLSEEAIVSRITAISHALEKGLSHPERKDAFAIGYAEQLSLLLKSVLRVDQFERDPRLMWAVSTLGEWVELHEEASAVSDELLDHCRETLRLASTQPKVVTTLEREREEVQSAARGDFESLAFSRHSIRDFTPSEVDIGLIHEAVRIASRSPSACNRQATRVISLSKGEDMLRALELQSGNRGFGEKIDKLLIVGFDTRAYLDQHERNLGFVDTGIFVMSLIHALHYLGLGTCCLNWAVDAKTEQAMSEQLRLPSHFSISCLVAVGHLPDEFKVAASHRLPAASILEVRA